jgi:cyclomaltodextrinase
MPTDGADALRRTPEWARHAIWYQIFPERFCNGDPSNDPQPCRPWTSEWFTPSDWERPHADAFYSYVFQRRYGGDLAGIRKKLPYLKELGVNALYLNPVFQAESLHKYEATNYLHVDGSSRSSVAATAS